MIGVKKGRRKDSTILSTAVGIVEGVGQVGGAVGSGTG